MIFGMLNPEKIRHEILQICPPHLSDVNTLPLLKNDFSRFPKVKWLYLTGEVDKSVSVYVKFSQDLTYQKLLKSVNF